jgi:hypothetical protein
MNTMTENGIVTRSGPLVIVDGEFSECLGVHEIRVHHRDWPELHGEGETPREAVEHLLRQLFTQGDSVASSWRREGLERVIAETQEFLA